MTFTPTNLTTEINLNSLNNAALPTSLPQNRGEEATPEETINNKANELLGPNKNSNENLAGDPYAQLIRSTATQMLRKVELMKSMHFSAKEIQAEANQCASRLEAAAIRYGNVKNQYNATGQRILSQFTALEVKAETSKPTSPAYEMFKKGGQVALNYTLGKPTGYAFQVSTGVIEEKGEAEKIDRFYRESAEIVVSSSANLIPVVGPALKAVKILGSADEYLQKEDPGYQKLDVRVYQQIPRSAFTKQPPDTVVIYTNPLAGFSYGESYEADKALLKGAHKVIDGINVVTYHVGGALRSLIEIIGEQEIRQIEAWRPGELPQSSIDRRARFDAEHPKSTPPTEWKRPLGKED